MTALYYSKGIEIQGHLSGVQYTLQFGPVIFQEDEFQLYGGYSHADRPGRVPHATEKGKGWGAGLGWKHWWQDSGGGFFVGARAEIWRMRLDWKDSTRGLTGVSQVTVLQPLASAGYRFLWNKSLFSDIGLSAGREYNSATHGEAVAEGFLLRAGISLGWK
jgi:hypothetical protein